jgi:hypothetical protein
MASSRSTPKKLLGLVVVVAIGAGLLAVLFIAGRMWWVALRGPETSTPTAVATTGTASISIAWDKSPAPAVAGYKVLFGTQPGVYSDSVSVGDQATATLGNLRNGTKYYIVTVAVDASGNQSPPSNEIEVVTAK